MAQTDPIAGAAEALSAAAIETATSPPSNVRQVVPMRCPCILPPLRRA
jgi:hypothetical protein